ncbi:achaete-scute homolog 3 [Bufo bufo]|uniref:achaete-scute homolog 3 n=1 Tax=Bufo bufo TaxID=8384 RepID=UPI001ABDBCAB|nr:achaete-scute homolog 3 [Bufo bufo]
MLPAHHNSHHPEGLGRTMGSDLYNPPERPPLVSDALALSTLSLPPFCVDTSMMFHLPPEMYQWHRCQDMTLLSHVETPRLQHYYSSLYSAQLQRQQYGYEDGLYGPSYICKRNERERQRVRCVNEGYARLQRHLPQEYMEKRLSKVQTLRAAIKYISHLQETLCWENTEDSRDAIRRHEKATNNQRHEH